MSALFYNLWVWIMSLTLLFGANGWAQIDPAEAADRAVLDGAVVTLEKAFVKKDERGISFFAFAIQIENGSDQGIMSVSYDLDILNEDGEVIWTFSPWWYGETKALEAGSSMRFVLNGYRRMLDEDAASIALKLRDVKDETELPPVVLPEKGQYLTEALEDERLANIREEMPAKIRFGIDHGGALEEAVFDTPEEIEEAVELICRIKIGEETDTSVTDNYNYISFTWPDGTESGISLNLYNLEYRPKGSPVLHYYELEDLGDFWSYGAAHTVPADDGYQGGGS